MSIQKPATVSTPRLSLRALSENDREAVCALLKSEQIAKTYMLPTFKDEEAVAALFETFRKLSNAPDRVVYGIDLDGTVIGLLNETTKTENDIELGYLIAPAHWGKGYATEALGGCIKALFKMGYDTVTAGFFEENAASRRVMEKCGMRPTGKTEEIEYRGVRHKVIFFEIKG